MKYALELAEHGRGRTSPNPVVGAVIVKEGQIIGEGWHQQYGGPHAEINAFIDAGERAEGSELYVTLEPCSHYGKTPPCVKTILEKKVKKVIIGMKDPNPLVAGRGIQMLEEAGIEVIYPVLEEECQRKNEIFLKYITTGLPFVVMKSAMTLDGKIASFCGDSKWISGLESRQTVQKMRNSLTGILVGVQTVIKDNPLLTTRIEGGRNPIRIIADSHLRIPLDAKVLSLQGKDRCILAVAEGAEEEKKKKLLEMGIEIIETSGNKEKVNLTEMMRKLGEKKIDSILLEGGGELNFSAFTEGIVDKCIFFLAPKLLGGRKAKTPIDGEGIEKVADAIKLRNLEYRKIGEDLMIEADVEKGEGTCLQES